MNSHNAPTQTTRPHVSLAGQISIRPTENRDAMRDPRDAELDRLRHEIHRLKGSRAWALGRRLQHLLTLPGLPRTLIGRPVELKPISDSSAEFLGHGLTRWNFSGSDPQVQLLWSRLWQLPRGRYELLLSIPDPQVWSREMRLYVDEGAGYGEARSTLLRFSSRRDGLYVAPFMLHDLAEAIRLDPADGDDTLTIGRAKVRRITRTEFYARAFLSAAREFRGTGKPVRAAIRWAARSLRHGGPRGLAADIRGRLASSQHVSYSAWLERHDSGTTADLERLRSELLHAGTLPRIAVLMPVFNTPEHLLRGAIDSVLQQAYQDWQLCIADDGSSASHITPLLRAYAAKDSRISWIGLKDNGHISRASNKALELVTADWVALLDHDDILRPNALAEVALEIARHPNAELVYSDEDKISEDGTRFDPHFKPDFSRDLLRSQNYLNHLTVHRTANVRAVGGWRPGFEGSQDYDLILRICEQVGFKNVRHIPKVLYHWRATRGSTARAQSEKGYAFDAGLRALREHVERMALPATVEGIPGLPYYRLRPASQSHEPLVSLIVPTRDRRDLLQRAICSIVDKTTYQNYEIIVVDNGTTDPETLDYLASIAQLPQVRVLSFDRPFNYSAINNFACAHARGEIIGLVNNDVEVISPDWLSEMVFWAAQSDIGCVGAKLYYPNDTIQHAGVILGIGGVAGHSHKYFARTKDGYFGRLRVAQNLSAVTGACLIVRKPVYDEVGGLDAENLAVAFNDVDFCLKVRAAGYLNVWTPFAELYHHESVSRGVEDDPMKVERFNREASFMMEKWDLNDPFYSPNLTLMREDFSLAD
ncbi:MAG: glycosyltransferase family 2 protein [Devosia sp.]|nr:glycosyltransferase family 2 protein [Devosia sp.]